MSAESKPDLRPEIAHVLFMDIVEYSKLSINEQSELIDQLSEIARGTEQFHAAEAAGKLSRLPTGDGIALVFFNNPEAPVRCALEISSKLATHPELRLRMGIHSGPVNEVLDVNDRSNVAGAGIDIAQRVMDCGDAGHILLSKRSADDLVPYKQWRSSLQELGEFEVKHGERISIFNLFTGEAGNPRLPAKLKRRSGERPISAAVPSRPPASSTFTGRKRAWIIAAVAAVAACIIFGLFIFSRTTLPRLARPSVPTPGRPDLPRADIPSKSIAVLPFENLSKDEENAFFAGGVQDEILTDLARIADLKVISRTSVMKYKSGPERNLRDVAKALGVAHIVEGSVQRAGGRVRVNAQLIDARSDSHLWAEHYDRDVADVFAIQSEIAQAIADQLQAKLSPTEKASVEARPTQNAAAYLLYLQALDTWRHSQTNEELRQVEATLEKAYAADSSFALALARLSIVESFLYLNKDPLPGRLEKARATANEALRLQPNLPEAHMALGQVYLREHDYERALAELTVAKAGLPNDSSVFLSLGAIERRQGRWSQSTADTEKATELDPKDAFLWMNLATNYRAFRQFPRAADVLDRACAAEPNFYAAQLQRAQIHLDWKGDLSRMDELLSHTPETFDPNGLATLFRFHLRLFQRRYNEAIDLLKKSPLDRFAGIRTGGPYPKSFLLGCAYFFLKDDINTRSAFEAARGILENGIREEPNDAARHALLGWTYAGLKRKKDAVREGKRAVELLPESADAFDGPLMILVLAQIYTLVGDFDSALPLIEHSLCSPAGITVPLLKLDPVWDPLRNDPRFERLLAKFETSPTNS